MRQADFETRHAPDWDAFEKWLDTRAKTGPFARKREPDPAGLPDTEVPQAYRRLFGAELLLADDCVAPTGVARRAGLSDRAARRLFERLVELDAAREVSGRSSFRLYGL